MPLVGKKTPGSAPGYRWDDKDTVHDLPHDLAHALVSTKDADFYTVAESAPEPEKQITEPAPAKGRKTTEPAKGSEVTEG